MKDTAKCDIQCESQNSANHKVSERKLCCYTDVVATGLFQNLYRLILTIFLLFCGLVIYKVLYDVRIMLSGGTCISVARVDTYMHKTIFEFWKNVLYSDVYY